MSSALKKSNQNPESYMPNFPKIVQMANEINETKIITDITADFERAKRFIYELINCSIPVLAWGMGDVSFKDGPLFITNKINTH